jgi:hypothetical protein
MALLIGVLLAFSVGLFATGLSLDRDRAFYPVVTIVIASYYALFAVMGASTHTLVLESLVGAFFLPSQFQASSGHSGLSWLRSWAMASSILPMKCTLPMQACPFGGRSSVSHTILRPRHIWLGCSRAGAFAPQPESNEIICNRAHSILARR